MTRAHAILDHAQRDGVEGLISVVGGKFTTFRLMAEEAVNLAGAKLGTRATGAVDVAIEGAPDNLTWTDRGTLLLASHTAGAGFMLCVLGRSPCRSSWAVYEIDPNTLVVSEVIKHSGDTVGAVATALEIKGTLLLSSVFDDRIGYVTRP
jgi:hypothetical protein